MSDFALFKHLEKPTVLRVYLLLEDGAKERLEAVARIIAEPYLELKFRPDELPMKIVRPGGKILLSLDTRVGTVSMYAHIDAVTSQRVLRVLAMESFSFAQEREYFRVNAPVSVVCQRVMPGSDNKPEPITAKTVNISGNGALICCDTPLKLNELYELIFYFEGQLPQKCTVRVVRVREKLRGGFEIALHYVSIEQEMRDALISFCLAQQRQSLRTKVQISDFN
ncbi:MAG: PilZ domain-containing protein [Desulfuromonadaceae bacterium]|nr:PilZ domain-containing protein [Desulfuromonas sp.]MDY0186041.1 PilZ domain-containing protein [Desulfuromonadaceae bacterium]